MAKLKICILGLALASCSRGEEELSDTAAFSEPAANYEIVYDVGLANRLANAANTVSKKKVTEEYNPCWARVWEAMKWTYGNHIENTSVGRPHAYDFAKWANPDSRRLYDTFKLKKKSFVGSEIPVGSVVVWKPGSCGYSRSAGHIEVVVSPGRACSFYCGPICTSAVPEVYVPVKKQLKTDIFNSDVATNDISNQVWNPGMSSTNSGVFTPSERPLDNSPFETRPLENRPLENKPTIVTPTMPGNTPFPQVVSPAAMPSGAPDSQCKYGRDSAGFCKISPDLNPFALAH